MKVTTHRFVIVLAATFISSFQSATSANCSGQQPERFHKQLEAGEFGLALATAQSQTSADERNRMLGELATVQRRSDTGLNCFDTASQIEDERLRGQAFNALTTYHAQGFDAGGFGSSQSGDSGSGANDFQAPANGPGRGNGGGITEADFDELMDLIQETIDPDSWEANGGSGRMRPFPSGVFVDASGTMRRIEKDNTGRLQKIRQATASDLNDASLFQKTELRKISLLRLERQLQKLEATGQDIPDDLKHLAGIYQLRYVMLYPETGDIVLAGPAGPWHYDRLGRAINTETKAPVLNLDDLVVSLRNVKNNGGQFQCSIDPKPDNLAAAKQITETSTLKGRALRQKIHNVLGKMDVTIDGIDPASHAARVIVEADYQMKLIGLGVAPTVSKMDNYFERIHMDEEGRVPASDTLVRWWFTMNYDSVQTNEERTIFELNGQGVKLLSESEFWNEQGERVHTGQSSSAAKGFADDFTRRFPEIAADDPVFGQLKNVFDCALAASIIHNEGLDRKVNWRLQFLLGSDDPGKLRYIVQTANVPIEVDSILGQRVIKKRVAGKNLTTTISGFGGGVGFDYGEHVAKNKIEVVADAQMAKELVDSKPQSKQHAVWTWN